MARNFIDEDERPQSGMSYRDGFRFGFGFFIANLLGLMILGALITGVNLALGRLPL